MKEPSDYRKAYEAAKQELKDLLSQQAKIEKRLLVMRQSLETLSALCETEGVEIDESDEAASLLENSTLADEIRRMFAAADLNARFRPSQIKDELRKLGHDLSQYANPQATIHMVLKRMAESKDIREQKDSEGKAVYSAEHPLWKLRAKPRKHPEFGKD